MNDLEIQLYFLIGWGKLLLWVLLVIFGVGGYEGMLVDVQGVVFVFLGVCKIGLGWGVESRMRVLNPSQ